MEVRPFSRRLISVLLCASLAGTVFTGCQKGDDMFPSINPASEEAEVTESSGRPSDPAYDTEIRHINVALPYSDLTIQCLASLLYCKNSGIWDSAESGLTVDTDYLSSVATNYVISNSGCRSTGVSLDKIIDWKSSGTMPDLFLAEDSEAVWNAGYAGELNSYLSDDLHLNSQQLYAGALTNNSDNGVFFAVPHYCASQIVIGNTEFIPKSTGKLQTKNSTDDLRGYLEAINEEYPSIAPFAYAYEMIPYLGSAFNGDIPTSYMVNEEYSKDRENAKNVISGAADYIKDLYSDSLAADDIDGVDPIIKRNAALWIDSSAEIGGWMQYFPGNLYLLHLPCDDASNAGVPYITTYSLCVSKDASDSAFAAEFASFISFDPDAQLLIYRLENMTGLMPLIRNDAIWDLVTEDEFFGHMASDIRQTMDNAVYCPESNDSKVYFNTNEYTAGFVKQDGDFDPEKCYG